MKKLIFSLFFLHSVFFYSQILGSFSTNFSVTDYENNKNTTEMSIDWTIYENKLIGIYKDKKLIKQLEKLKQPTEITIDLNTYSKNSTFKKDSFDNYIFNFKTNDLNYDIRIIVTLNQLIKITTKDTFTGKISDLSYVKI
jgi:hypothetical protein